MAAAQSASTSTPALPLAKAEYLRGGLDAVQGWLNRSTATYLSCIEVLQRRAGVHGDVCEIGVHHGRSFLCLALGLPADQRAVAIDVFEDQARNVDGSGKGDRAEFQRHLDELGAGDNVEIVQASSLDLHDNGFVAAGRRFRLFSIDGGHTAEITANDLTVAERTVVDGAAVVLDDFLNPHWLGVITGLFDYWRGGGSLTPAVVIPGKLVLATSEVAAGHLREMMRGAFEVACNKRRVHLGPGTVDVYGEFPFVIRDEDGGEGLLVGTARVSPKGAAKTRAVPIEYLERLEAATDRRSRSGAPVTVSEPPARRRFARVRNRVADLVRRLPPPRDQAGLEILTGLKTMVTGRSSRPPR